MTGDDLALVDRLRASGRSESVTADDPAAVADALVGAGGRRLDAGELATWAEEAALLRQRADAVLAAEEVVARAVSFEQSRRAALLWSATSPERPPPAASAEVDDDHDEAEHDGPEADRQSVRFALVVLVPSQLGGAAVYAADGMLLAVLAPAVAIAGVIATAWHHRRRRPPVATGSPDREPAPAAPLAPSVAAAADVPAGPVVRAAEAHLRRQRAAWKLAWWERGLRPVDVSTWVGRRGDAARRGAATLVVVDEAAAVEEPVLAAMAAALPAAVRVVVIRPR